MVFRPTLIKIEDGKIYAGEIKAQERQAGGNCYFCEKPVYISEGQLLKYYKQTNKFTGLSESYPTHKKCRKKYGKLSVYDAHVQARI